jgi:DNA-binding XRE family transcriptional regulator
MLDVIYAKWQAAVLQATSTRSAQRETMRQARDPVALRAAVERRDLTHRELARLVECTHTTILFVLNGAPVNDKLARRLARVLRCRVADLFAVVGTSSELDQRKQRAAS